MSYEVDGKRYGAVRNFCQYQRPKKPSSTYPQSETVRNWANIEARSTRDGGGTRHPFSYAQRGIYPFNQGQWRTEAS